MATFVYNRATRDAMKGDVDLDTKAVTAVLVGTTTTISAAGAQGADAATVTVLSSGAAVFAEYTGANYARKNLFSSDTVVTQDDANNRTEWDSADIVYTALGSDSRSCGGILLYLGSSTDNDSDNVPLAYLDITTFNGNTGNVTISWNAQGILQYSAVNAP